MPSPLENLVNDPRFRELGQDAQFRLALEADPTLDPGALDRAVRDAQRSPLRDLIEDQRFGELPRENQRRLAKEAAPNLGDEDLDQVLEQYAPKYKGLVPNAQAGLAGPVADALDMGGNAAYRAAQALQAGLAYGPVPTRVGLLDQFIAGREGRAGTSPMMGTLTDAPKVRGDLEEVRRRGDQTLKGRIIQTGTGLVTGLPVALAATHALGPVGGFAALGALHAAHPGAELEDIATEAAKGGAIGSAFKFTAPLMAPLRAAAVGGTSLAADAVSGTELDALGATTNALLASLPSAARRARVAERRMGRALEQMESRAAPEIPTAEPVAARAGEPREALDPTPPEVADTPAATLAAEMRPSPQLKKRILDSKGVLEWAPGPNYVGQQTFTQAQLSKPIPPKLARGRNDIMVRLAKAFGQTVVEGTPMRVAGHRGGKGTLGFFVNKNTLKRGGFGAHRLMRVKRWGDIETTAHEFMHRLVDSHPTFRRLFERSRAELKAMTPAEREAFQKQRAELIGLSYDVRIPEEGLAEFGRLWMTQRAELDAPARMMLERVPRQGRKPGGMQFRPLREGEVAGPRISPETLAAFERAVDSLPPKQAAALRTAQQEMHAFFEQGALATASDKIGGAPPSIGARVRRVVGGGETPRELARNVLEGVGDRVREKHWDDYHQALRMERQLKDGTGPVSDGFYQAARALRGIGEVARGLVVKGVPTWTSRLSTRKRSIKFEGEGLEQILARAKDQTVEAQRETILYMVGRQGRELYQKAIETPFTEQEIRAMEGLRTEAREQAYQALKIYQAQVKQFAIDGGLLSAEQAAAWQRAEYAFAFSRDLSGGNVRAGGPSVDPLASSTGVYRIRGSSRDLQDPLVSMIEGPARLIQLTLENIARQKLAAMSKLPGAGMFFAPISTERRVKLVPRDQVVDYFDTEAARMGVPEKMRDAMKLIMKQSPHMLEFWSGGHKPAGDRVMTVLYNGQPRYYEIFDDGLVRALGAFRRPELGGAAMRFFNGWRRLKQEAITLDPSFIAANVVRDSIMSSVMTRTGHQAVTSGLRGMKDALTQNEWYWDYIANGGGGATARDATGVLRKSLRDHARKTGFNPEKLLLSPVEGLRWLGEKGRQLETGPRVGEYRRAIEQGKSDAEAAYMGREITTDYAMRGNSQATQFLGQVIPFFNAMMVGGDRLYRSLARDPTHRGATMAKTLMVGLFSAALYEWNRHNPRYNDLAQWDKNAYWHFFSPDGDHAKIPKVWEVGALGTLAEYVMAGGHGDEKSSELWKAAGWLLLEQFGISPPVGFDLLQEQWANKVWFTGAPIEPMGTRMRQPADRYTSGTSETMRAIASLGRGSALEVSPARAEALLRGVFGNWAYYGLSATDLYFYDTRMAKHWDDMPVFRRFTEREGKNSRYIGEFYKFKEEIDATHGSYNLARRNRDMALAKTFDRRQLSLHAAFQRSEHQLSALARTIQRVRSDRTTSPAEKTRRVDKLEAIRTKIMRARVELAKRRLDR